MKLDRNNEMLNPNLFLDKKLSYIFHLRNWYIIYFFLAKKMNSLRSFYFEKPSYLHSLMFAYRQETVEILNDNDLLNNEKSFHCIIFADNFAKLFEWIHFVRLCLYLLN